MKEDTVDVAGVPDQLVHELAVRSVPHLYAMIVAARGDPFAVRADGQRPHPAGMSVDGAQGLRLVAGNRPPENAAVVSAGHERFAFVDEGERPDPTLVSDRIRKLVAIRHAPSLHRVILGAGEDELA